jgi:hypothetical protein
MAQTTCLQCGSNYEEGEKFCPRDDTPLTRLVECRKCLRPIRPDAPFCAHCRGAKVSVSGSTRGRFFVILAGAALLVILAFAGLRFGPKALRAARHGAGSILAAMPSLPTARPASLASKAPAGTSGLLEGTHRPGIAEYDFQIHQSLLLGDALRGAAASVNGGPVPRPAVPGRAAPRAQPSRTFLVTPVPPMRPVVRHAALHVPRTETGAWQRDGELEGRLVGLGMPDVQVMRKDRSLRLSGSVASDGELRTLYGLVYNLGYGEVSYEVEVR